MFPSSPGPISVFFSNVFHVFTSLHLFVYSFKHVIQVHCFASIHLQRQHKSETWKIGLCSTFKVIKCLCSIKCKCKGWIPGLLSLGTTVCIYVATPSATTSSWNLSHPSEKLLNWSTKYILYDTSQLQLRKHELNSINNLNDTPPKHTFMIFCRKLALLMVVCWPKALKNKRSSRTWLMHPSSPHLWLRWKFFEKIRNIFLHHLVALSSCNTRFEEEK